MHEYFPEDDFMMNVCAKAISLVKLRIDDVSDKNIKEIRYTKSRGEC